LTSPRILEPNLTMCNLYSITTNQPAISALIRVVNPWRRCLGAAVLAYELKTNL
jgi:hypothetical protein